MAFALIGARSKCPLMWGVRNVTVGAFHLRVFQIGTVQLTVERVNAIGKEHCEREEKFPPEVSGADLCADDGDDKPD